MRKEVAKLTFYISLFLSTTTSTGFSSVKPGYMELPERSLSTPQLALGLSTSMPFSRAPPYTSET
jgi:hypothetical protein